MRERTTSKCYSKMRINRKNSKNIWTWDDTPYMPQMPLLF